MTNPTIPALTTHDIMHCTRVFRAGDRFDRVRVTSSRVGSFGFQDYGFSKIRPTGAHRQSDNVWADANVVILVDDPVHGPSFECPREWQDGMSVGFDYIRIPRV